MPVYAYKGMTPAGKSTRGHLDAETSRRLIGGDEAARLKAGQFAFWYRGHRLTARANLLSEEQIRDRVLRWSEGDAYEVGSAPADCPVG